MATKKLSVKRETKKLLPSCKAILLAEKIIVEAGTGMVSLIGIIGGYGFAKYPARVNPSFVFLHLAEGEGHYEINLEIHDQVEKTILARAKAIPVEMDRLLTANLIVQIPPLVLSQPGNYDIVVFADDQEIDRQRFGAQELESLEEAE